MKKIGWFDSQCRAQKYLTRKKYRIWKRIRTKEAFEEYIIQKKKYRK